MCPLKPNNYDCPCLPSPQCLYLSIFMLPLADAVTLFFFNPAMTTTGAFLILRESVGMIVGFGLQPLGL